MPGLIVEGGEGRSGTWSKQWQQDLEPDERNHGLVQTLDSKTFSPREYQLGSLTISQNRIHFVDWKEPISSDELKLTANGMERGLRLNRYYFYRGSSSNDPQLGDERVSYHGIRVSRTATYFGAISNGVATGKQFGNSNEDGLSRYVNLLIQNDGFLHYLVNGNRDQALVSMREYLTWITWMVRLAGTAGIIAGIFMFFSSFTNLLLPIPVLGELLNAGVFLVSVCLGLSIGVTVIIAGYIFNHPFLVLLPLSLVIGVTWFLRNRAKVAKKNVRKSLKKYQAKLAHQQPRSTAARRASKRLPENKESPLSAEEMFTSLAQLAMVDGKFDKKENNFIVKWGQENGIEYDRMKALFNKAKQRRGEIQVASRDEFIWMVCLAMEDGALSAKELTHLKSLGRKIGVDDKDLREIVVGIETGLFLSA